MNLQHLEISGFKSFPDRSQLRFDDGVTAIVGPNGCGKSNVVDAITWVLGEQSAKSLRGDRMEDVIFGGTDGRKATGAAEVKLMLRGVTAVNIAGSNGHTRANGDGKATGNGNGHLPHAVPEKVNFAPPTNESRGAREAVGSESEEDGPETNSEGSPPIVARDVEVSRRLYRSGESEYLIDGKVCRLRDIQDLLMDSGVGLKAYAIIEQGKIGQILSARPNDRRQLIEEAAGVTKYKTRRHAAELKLEAARQNLLRVDDIVHEVDKQRNALKRQAAKARRYRRLRDGLRLWEKILFARRHRTLALAIETADAKLAEAQASERAAAARLAELETRQERLRIELTEGETRATSTRDVAHTRELEIDRRQHQLEFDRQQVAELSTNSDEIRGELKTLDAKRTPACEEVECRRSDVIKVGDECRHAEQQMTLKEASHTTVRNEVQDREGDVEAARSELLAAINAVTALRHVAEHTSSARDRVTTELAKLDVETSDLDVERSQLDATRQLALTNRASAQTALDQASEAYRVRRKELSVLQDEREGVVEAVRAGERELSALTARLKSLEELEAARAGYGDAARLILSESNGNVRHMGSVADHLEVDDRYEVAVEACLSDFLQYIVVARHEHAIEGLRFVRDHDAGRCGFLVVEGSGDGGSEVPGAGAVEAMPTGLAPLTSVVRASGSCGTAILAAIGEAYVAESFEQALTAATMVTGPIVTLSGDVVRGAHLVSGGAKAEARGLLATKREIKALRDAVIAKQTNVEKITLQLHDLDRGVKTVTAALTTLDDERQVHEKVTLELNVRLGASDEEVTRLARKLKVIDVDRRHAEEESTALEARDRETKESIVRLDAEQCRANDRLTGMQQQLSDARTSLDLVSQSFTDAKALHARLVERALAVTVEVRRLEDASAEFESRVASRRDDLSRSDSRRQSLKVQITESERLLDREVRELETLRSDVRSADDCLTESRGLVEAEQTAIRAARVALEEVRGRVGELEVSRATAQGEMSHLAGSCVEAVQADLISVIAEVEQLESDGEIIPNISLAQPPADDTDDQDKDANKTGGEIGVVTDDGASSERVFVSEQSQPPTTVDDMIVDFKEKIERLGPVNMMAIEQFDELDTRYAFLTTQRQDLLDSIGATTEAIRRINKTTKERFRVAFDAINQHYQHTFSTLFGGGRAGLVLLDETDLLESGVDIVAQPPGKRLQSVQLLSGGEKALSAMALMFAIFKYKPSPFCFLDEIDAPLDEANIGRFLDMLREMLDDTQFVLITHNRKTMEMADRLYGVTMEEPGVSKLISVHLN